MVLQRPIECTPFSRNYYLLALAAVGDPWVGRDSPAIAAELADARKEIVIMLAESRILAVNS
jgi:hypothetical protein